MPETCDSWAAAHVNTRAWENDRPWVAENAAWLRAAFTEAWTTGGGFVRAAFTHDYYDRIIAALEHVRTVVDRMAGHLNLAPIWIVPPAWRYPMEPGFVTYGPWTSSSARVDAADLQDGQTDSLRRRIAASIAEGRGTRDSAGTFYTRGGTAFLDPLSGYAPPVLGRLGNRPLVSGWSGTPEARSTWPIGHGVQLEVAQRAALRVIWEYMDRPDAPYVWWNAPSATAWPTAPVSSARWTLGAATGVLTAAQTGRVVVERAGSIDDGWGRGTGALDTEAGFPMPTPYLGPYANIRYAYATLMKIKAMSGHYAITRAIAEFAAWARGALLLGVEHLKEQKARVPSLDITSEMDEATALAGLAYTAGTTAATAAATAVNPLLGLAVALASSLFGGIGLIPGDTYGLQRAPQWPNRAAWWDIPVGDGKISGLALPPMWATMPPAGLDCSAVGAVRGPAAAGGDKGASKGSGAAVWIGGALAAGLVAAIAVAVAKAR
jgi:hypothetical protein